MVFMIYQNYTPTAHRNQVILPPPVFHSHAKASLVRAMSLRSCHFEPVTCVTGVAISSRFGDSHAVYVIVWLPLFAK